MNVLKVLSNWSTSVALSLSEMFLISAACAELLSDMFLWSCHLTIAQLRSPCPRVGSTILSGSFAVLFCAGLRNVSPQSSLTRIVFPSSDHACIHLCMSDLECRNYPLSLLPSHFSKNEVADSVWLGSSCFAVTFCCAVLMLLNMSLLPLTVSFISVRNCCVTSAISCLSCCWNVTISAVVTMSVQNSAIAGAAANADFRRPSGASTRDVAERRSASISIATLFCGNLQPTRMRWCICDKRCRQLLTVQG